MLVGICGSICAGKSTVAQYLVDHHGFTHLFLDAGSQDQEQKQGQPSELVNGGGTLADGPSHMTTPRKQPRLVPGHRSRQSMTFPSSGALLDYVTTRWCERWVTTDVDNEAALDIFSRRPFFLLISVDAPLMVRWRRHQQCRQRPQHQHRLLLKSDGAPSSPDGSGPDRRGVEAISLEDFVAASDQQLYDPAAGMAPLMSRAAVRLLNTSSDLAHLYATLGKVDLLDPDRLRPSWDTYFMALASLAARRSNCMKRRVGCVLVRDGRVVSTGYNGTPRGLRNCGEGGCGRCNGGAGAGVGLATCLCIHAEENALLEAGRERVRTGGTLYCDTCPCLTCSIKIAQVGIEEVVYNQGYSMDRETAAVFREAGVRLRQFVPPPNGDIHLEKMDLY